MTRLRSYLSGRWQEGQGAHETLLNPATEEPLAEAGSGGLDRAAALEHARRVGGPALRALTFAERGALLQALGQALQAAREELIELAVKNGGNTRSDAKFDVDGAIFTLSAYAELGRGLGQRRLLADGEGLQLGRTPRFHGQHVLVPRQGVAVHVNAFNFPAWGLCEKAAPALLAGMPVLGDWLQGLDERADAQAIERHLQRRWQQRVEAVARWLPARWHAALRQFGRLPLLAVAAGAGDDAGAVLAAWQADWQRALPADARPLRQALPLPAQWLLPRLAGRADGRAEATTAATQQRLQRLARRHPGSAVVVFAHLALQALALERLRGDLVVRALFAAPELP